jgi:O-antigen/teichoic acid export membrane protein
VAYSTLFAQFGTLGITGVTILLFPKFRDKESKHHGFLSMTLLVGLAGFALISLLQFLFKDLLVKINIEKSALFINYLNYLYLLVFAQVFFSILDVYYTSLFNSVYGSFLKEVFQRILIILCIGLFLLGWLNFHQFVILYVAAISIPTVLIVFRLIRDDQFSLRTEWSFYNKEILRSVITVSAFSILNSFSMIIIQNVDLLMVNSMVGISGAGVYSICFFFGVVVSLPARSINRIANVVAAEAWKINDWKTLNDVYRKSCLTLFIIGLSLFLGLWLNIDNVFHILREEYKPGKWVIFFIALGSLIDMLTGANSSILGTSKFYRIQTLFIIILVLLLIGTNLLFIPKYGIVGASIGSAVSLSALNVTRYLFLYVKFGFQPYTLKFAWVLFIGMASYAVSSLIPTLSNFIIDIMVRSTSFMVLFGLPVYFLKISDDINQKVNEVIIKLKKLRR